MNLTNLLAVSCTPTEQSGCDVNQEGAERLEEYQYCVFMCVCACVAMAGFIAVNRSILVPCTV